MTTLDIDTTEVHTVDTGTVHTVDMVHTDDVHMGHTEVDTGDTMCTPTGGDGAHEVDTTDVHMVHIAEADMCTPTDGKGAHMVDTAGVSTPVSTPAEASTTSSTSMSTSVSTSDNLAAKIREVCEVVADPEITPRQVSRLLADQGVDIGPNRSRYVSRVVNKWKEQHGTIGSVNSENRNERTADLPRLTAEEIARMESDFARMEASGGGVDTHTADDPADTAEASATGAAAPEVSTGSSTSMSTKPSTSHARRTRRAPVVDTSEVDTVHTGVDTVHGVHTTEVHTGAHGVDTVVHTEVDTGDTMCTPTNGNGAHEVDTMCTPIGGDSAHAVDGVHTGVDTAESLAARVAQAEARLAYQANPALTEALSEDELAAERELAERIRESERQQRWKAAQADAAELERDRATTAAIRRQDSRDVLLARKAVAEQRRQTSPHARLARLYRLRSWSLRALAGVVGAGMVWSAVNVQHNIAPGGMDDPLYWFSYLIEAMISVTLIVIMVGTNEVSEWGITDNKLAVAAADIGLLGLTLGLNVYPYYKTDDHFGMATHAVAPVMIGIALLVHHAASTRYGKAIAVATERLALAEDSPQLAPWQPVTHTAAEATTPQTATDQAAQQV